MAKNTTQNLIITVGLSIIFVILLLPLIVNLFRTNIYSTRIRNYTNAPQKRNPPVIYDRHPTRWHTQSWWNDRSRRPNNWVGPGGTQQHWVGPGGTQQHWFGPGGIQKDQSGNDDKRPGAESNQYKLSLGGSTGDSTLLRSQYGIKSV